MLTIKVRLYPTFKQQKEIDTNIDTIRWAYNNSLQFKIGMYKNFGASFGKFDMINRIARLKKINEYSFLKSVFAQSLQASMSNLDKAYASFFKGGGFPKFKSRFDTIQSIQFPSGIKHISDTKVKIPKIGNVKMRGWRNDLNGKIKLSTLVRDGSNYYLSMSIDVLSSGSNNGKSIGIDVGVKVFAYCSNGTTYKPLDLTKEIEHLTRKQVKLSRAKKGSNRRTKAKQRVNKAHKKIANKRKDYLHKITHKLSKNRVVIVEDLKIKNMSKSVTSGTIEAHAKGVKAKSSLNRSILQQSWGLFFAMLEYKLLMNKGQLIRVNPAHTSQQCFKCKHISRDNRRSQSEFKCVSCGHTDNADLNASKNILSRGSHDDISETKVA